MLPIAPSLGAVIGGMLVATFLSLHLVPALYTFWSRAPRTEETPVHDTRLAAGAE